MEAVVQKSHGDLNQVGFAQVPVPEIRADQVLVEIRAAALNRVDLWITQGWRGLKLQFPHILGSDGSGVVVKTGADVEDFSVGDRVAINPTLSCGKCTFCIAGQDNRCKSFALFGEHVPGLFGQFQAVPERNLLALPAHVSHEKAAAASLVYVTAWHSLVAIGNLKPGEDVLIIGAGGGVNSASVDIARFAGARKIIVVGSSEKKLKKARKLGATVTFNRNEEPWDKAVYHASEKQGVDIVVDNVGAATFSKSLRALKKGGRLLTVGNSSGAAFEIDNRYIFGKHLSILGSTMGSRKDYQDVMSLVFSGQLRPVIDSVYPLSEGPSALRRLQAGDVAGKILLKP
ncbi:MAG: zinc-binding dehydrogenase [Candidatus Promineifilaceae bacterium]